LLKKHYACLTFDSHPNLRAIPSNLRITWIEQAPNFWGLPCQRKHLFFSQTCFQGVLFVQEIMKKKIGAGALNWKRIQFTALHLQYPWETGSCCRSHSSICTAMGYKRLVEFLHRQLMTAIFVTQQLFMS
jgi:hypothetical protein